MEAVLKHINQLSSNLIGQLEQCDLESIEQYMEQRDELFTQLQKHEGIPAQNEAMKLLAAQIQKQDALIVQRMIRLRDEANREMVKLNQGKQTKSAYEAAPYGDDSFFFDTKR
ncbi:hypothetical protein M6D81_06870 [Paenibacillus sp. J5C_2022]|nr:hypothetical protein [Paenibacillus sp. J5C2022]